MKQSRIILLFIAFTFGIIECLNAQGNERQDRQIASFSGVKVSSGITLYLTQGDDNKVVVEADGDIIDDVVTNTDDGILHIYIPTKKIFRLNSSPKVYVTFSWINSIEASAGSQMLGQNTFMLDNLKVQNSSGATSEFEVECRDLEMRCSSGASIITWGSTLNLTAKSSSGSTIKAKELKTVNAKLEASSGATIQVHVSGELEASASSGGGISYYGEAIPKLLQQSSGGNIKKR